MLDECSRTYPELRKSLYACSQKSYYDKMLGYNPIDYYEVRFNFEHKYKKVRGGQKAFTAEELEKVQNLRLHLKNAVMYHVNELRFNSKHNSLIRILQKGVREMVKRKRL